MDLIVVQSDLGFLEQLLNVDALKIGCCARFHDQFISCAACSSVCEAVWFGVRSFPAPLKPAPIFLSFNSFRREPVLCLSGPGAVTSFKIDVIVFSICCSKPSTVGLGFVKREDAKISC